MHHRRHPAPACPRLDRGHPRLDALVGVVGQGHDRLLAGREPIGDAGAEVGLRAHHHDHRVAESVESAGGHGWAMAVRSTVFTRGSPRR